MFRRPSRPCTCECVSLRTAWRSIRKPVLEVIFTAIHHPSPPRSRVVILPVELLLIIFKLVREQEALERRLGWSQPDILLSSHFLHAIAAVCSLWRDASAGTQYDAWWMGKYHKRIKEWD